MFFHFYMFVWCRIHYFSFFCLQNNNKQSTIDSFLCSFPSKLQIPPSSIICTPIFILSPPILYLWQKESNKNNIQRSPWLFAKKQRKENMTAYQSQKFKNLVCLFLWRIPMEVARRNRFPNPTEFLPFHNLSSPLFFSVFSLFQRAVFIFLWILLFSPDYFSVPLFLISYYKGFVTHSLLTSMSPSLALSLSPP